MNPGRTPPSISQREAHRRQAYAALTRNAPASETSSVLYATAGTANVYPLHIPQNSSSLEHPPLPQQSFLSLASSNSSGHRTRSIRSNSTSSSRRHPYPRSPHSENASPPSSPLRSFIRETHRVVTRPIDLILGTQRIEERIQELDYELRVQRNAVIRAKLESELESLEREEREEIEERNRREAEGSIGNVEARTEALWTAAQWDQMFFKHQRNEEQILDGIVRRAPATATASASAATSSTVTRSNLTVSIDSSSAVSSSSSPPSSTSSLASFVPDSPSPSPSCTHPSRSPAQPFADSTNIVTLRDNSRRALRERRLEESKRLGRHMDHLVIAESGREGAAITYDPRDYDSPLERLSFGLNSTEGEVDDQYEESEE